MRHIKRIILVFAVVSTISISDAWAYQWPFNNTPTATTTYNIDATLGEPRTSHFHIGADINKTTDELDDPVYAVNRGIFYRIYNSKKPNDEYVSIKSIDANGNLTGAEMIYMHVNGLAYNTNNDLEGKTVEIGSPIAKIKEHPEGNHLHFTERDENCYYNPLREGGLDNYTDNPPTGRVKMLYQELNTKSTNGIQFFRNLQSENPLATNDLSGGVDIQVPVHDRPGTHEQRIGIYKLEYKIWKNNKLFEHYIPFTFDDMPGDSEQGKSESWKTGTINLNSVAYDKYLYCATNDPFKLGKADRYWNTKQKNVQSMIDVRRRLDGKIITRQEETNTINAQFNDEAKFPDGAYKVEVKAYDIKGNSGVAFVDVNLDNFTPNIYKIIINQNGYVKYASEYTPGRPMDYRELISETLSAGQAKITILFSEEMPESYSPVVKFGSNTIAFQAGRSEIKTAKYSNDSWTGYFSLAEAMVPNQAQSFQIVVSGVKDLAGNDVRDVERYVWIGTKGPQVIARISDYLMTKGGETGFSPYQPIFNLEFPNPPNEAYKIQAVFKTGNAANGVMDDIFNWNLSYNPQTHVISEPAPNSYTAYTIVKDAKTLLQFDWNGDGYDGEHHDYDEDVIIEVKVKDAAGNETVDNSQQFRITPEGILYDPNDPQRSRERQTAQYGQNANKTFFLPSMVSVGGTEFSNLKKLFGKFNIDFRPFNQFGDAKTASIDSQVEAIKKQVSAFSANSADKVTMVAWGQAGVLASEYLRRYAPVDKVAKLVTISTPVNGINSIPMAIQSYSINLLFTPIVSLISQLGLESAFSFLQKNAGEYGPDLSYLSFLQQVNRNDLVINPLNFIGMFLGRQDYAKNFQSDSQLLKDLRQFNSGDSPVPTASVATALWPDMPDVAQVGIVGGFAILGAAGVYSGVELFSLSSPTYNNINNEVAEILANLVEAELSKLVLTPIRSMLNESMEKADDQYLLPIWKQWFE